MIWLRALLPALAGLAIASALAWLFGAEAAAWFLAAFFGIWSLVQASFIVRLHWWAALPRKRDLPLGVLAWELAFDRLGRFLKQESDTRQALTTELEQIHAAVDQLPDGLTVLDRFDHVDWFNNAAGDLHGIFGVKRPIHHFVRDPDFVAYLDSADYSRPPVVPLPARPGRLFELRLHRTADGSKLLITRDITSHAKLDAMRRDFVANVSHEIRTPVTVIGGFAETLLDLQLDEATRRDYLGTILKQSQTMQRLVEDLLMLSSLENSESPPAHEPVDVHALARTVADEARALSQGRHTIEVRLDGPRQVRAVPLELESAVRNLVTNAVRYTPAGGRIEIAWRIREHEGWLTVSDTGIGVSPEHIPRLTERFYRVDRGRSRETGGTGLGLAIVKHVVQRLDGALHVDSRLGEGSAFSLRLPAARLLPDAAPAGPDDVDRAESATE